MTKIDDGGKRGRGRPPEDTEPLTVRLPRPVIRAIDEARRRADPIPTRTDVVRWAVVDWLTASGLLEKDNQG